MRARTLILLAGLAGAAALYAWSRTRRGGELVGAGLETAWEFIDVSASRVTNAVSSRGYRNNNPGNLRFIVTNPWNGQVGDDGGYGIYSSPQLGTRALGKQLLKYAAAGRRTVRAIIATWAPPNENNTTAYVLDVAAQLDVDPDESLDVEFRLGDIARAIAKHENGYLDSTYNFDAWVRL